MANEYTTTAPANIMPGSLRFPSEMISEYEDTSSRTSVWPSVYIEFPRPSLPSTAKTFDNGFIGILTDEEAESMKEDLKLFKKRFNDDFARKNKILFGY
ncbi:hypothetical protein A3G55_03925 [Candidatus Giovannonibacteria bacterium RIFCSPLOWO2_12_FULL_44_25]|uniref:Uncharacterized protein n=3 Tax=Candidatus Giovannoniibacteriota TaxID=1752738 RepID=A0A0G1IDX6_9BACT|nr:MAG: hypothetical protein UW49_C0009G0044 [Candidatus Giovannonibacteria bacterium GW2011_GWB1_44_23]KKT59634.1 MAG: hypothetical protein UW53_C0010G0044 [Candidatus Giovannonibacteria bacterium GW2011_GWA1_44_25]OGF49820.1 MAG: hypothetical protein A2120_01210 [Candidatus Giovannonibacteria bacterium GWA2_45_15]OGF60221.1 MAG: hypothetical protein A2656_00150 [Candidatus Giovannonibacteria bacterium RIFCSPHIGHO2_01_FULL_44_100]OGF71409.1 MAG: hypothetical protein A3C05_01400 [Candidatus Gio